MSETKLATKADLKEMYDRMLPYLGGMPEMLANKFSKGDLYSTDEKMIGQWIDGKPLYAKTFTKIFQSTDENTWQTLGSIGDVNIAYYQACLKTANGSFMFKDDAYVSSDYKTQEMYHSCILKVQSGELKAFLNFDTGLTDFPAPYFVTLYYTKTSDSAVSIGDETDYSTTEKIVGTWIDGSTIYQKTIVDTMPEATTLGTVVPKDISVNANVDKFIDIKIMIKSVDTNNEYYIPLSNHDTVTLSSGEFKEVFKILATNNNSVEARKNKISIRNGLPGWSGTPVYITIQYTKTTS